MSKSGSSTFIPDAPPVKLPPAPKLDTPKPLPQYTIPPPEPGIMRPTSPGFLPGMPDYKA